MQLGMLEVGWKNVLFSSLNICEDIGSHDHIQSNQATFAGALGQ